MSQLNPNQAHTPLPPTSRPSWMELRAENTRSIGRTYVTVTMLGIGGSPLGGSMARAMTDDEVVATLESGFASGMAYIDTAPHYGQGQSEKRLGAYFSKIPRETFTVSTKVGVTLVPGLSGIERIAKSGGFDFASTEPFTSRSEFTADAVKRGIEGSLQRMGLEFIDIAYIHDPDEAVTLLDPQADPYSKSHFREVMDEVYPVLEDLHHQGIIKAIGVGINQWQMLRDFARAGDFDCFLLARQYTLLINEGAAAELVPLCNQKKISLIIGGVYHNGILATGSQPADGSKPFMDIGEPSAEAMSLTQRIESVCRDFGVPLQAAALQFPFSAPCVVSVIPGVRSPAEIAANKNWFETSIPLEFWHELQRRNLVSDAISFG